MALICTPPGTLPSILADCGKKGIPGAIVLALGFSEAGEEGRVLEENMIAAARENNVRLVGPDTNGIFNLNLNMNLVGVPNVKTGNIGIVSQSGNIMLGLVAEAQRRRDVGFSTYIGVGHQVDIRFNEYLEFFGDDNDTVVPFMYVEGLKNGRRLLDAMRKVARNKPVVIYKTGRTGVGRNLPVPILARWRAAIA